VLVAAALREDAPPPESDAAAPLFEGGLGLDSIDALEIAIALDKRYGVKMRAEDEDARAAFASVRTLAEYVTAHRGGGAPG
jgi:acyl carrier protein